MQQGLRALGVVLSVVLMIIGAGFIAMYVWEGVISPLGDPDQSLLFWYLPVLFIGFFCFSGGVTLLLVTYRKGKQ